MRQRSLAVNYLAIEWALTSHPQSTKRKGRRNSWLKELDPNLALLSPDTCKLRLLLQGVPRSPWLCVKRFSSCMTLFASSNLMRWLSEGRLAKTVSGMRLRTQLTRYRPSIQKWTASKASVSFYDRQLARWQMLLLKKSKISSKTWQLTLMLNSPTSAHTFKGRKLTLIEPSLVRKSWNYNSTRLRNILNLIKQKTRA